MLAGRRGHRVRGERWPAESSRFEGLAGTSRVGRTHARQQLQHAECSDAVTRVVGPAQHREQVLDVRRLQELETAVLHERYVAAHELELEHVAVVRVPEQHRLATQLDAAFARLEHALDHVVGLCLVVEHRDVARPRPGAARAAQELAELPAALGHQRVGRIEHGLAGAVVFLERDDMRRHREFPGEIEDVVHRRTTKGIDRLRIVADHGQAAAVRLQREQDRGLHRVRILVLVDEDMVELRADRTGEGGIPHHHLPVEQQVVVVERLLGQLRLHVGAAKSGELVLPVEAPRVSDLERLAQAALGVDPVRIDAKARVLAREALLGLREPEALALDIHQVGRVAAVQHAERRIEAETVCVLADQPVADRVKRARPRQAHVCRRRRSSAGSCHRRGDDALRAASHLESGAPGEREQQQALRRYPGEQQVRDAMRKRAGLAGPGTGNHEQRRCKHATAGRRLAAGCSLALRGIQVGEGFRVGHRPRDYRAGLYGYPAGRSRAAGL